MFRIRKAVYCICLFIIFTITACTSKSHATDNFKVNILLEGGSGKASLTSPTDMFIKDGISYVKLEWSSCNYDYMIVDGKKYEPINTEGNSVFEIPVKDLDTSIDVIADTTAMSTSHEIEYKITVSKIKEQSNSEEGKKKSHKQEQLNKEFNIPDKLGDNLIWKKKLDISYAKGFSVDYYENEKNKAVYKLLTIYDDAQYLIIPHNQELAKGVSKDIVIINDTSKIYLTASQVMDMFDQLGEVDRIKFCALEEKDWYIDSAKERLNSGKMVYAGKYSSPDYEMIISRGCGLVIENTMIYHTPQVKEKLESFGIPVMVDRSSYENEPLGRVEWVKIYGAISNCENKAQEVFDKVVREFEEIESLSEQTNKPVVAFFYISSNGSIKVRKSDDYLPKMIELAGGKYVYDNIGSSENGKSSTINMQMEEFYATAKDADYIIYNSTVDGELTSVSELIKKNELLANFKAVKNKRVYCTSADLYQSSMKLGTITRDINSMIMNSDQMTYLYHLK